MEESVFVFTYGSLLTNLHNHAMMDPNKCEFGGYFVTKEHYNMLDLGSFPGVIDPMLGGNYKGVVIGECYWVEPSYVEVLDRFEGCPDFYRRETVRVYPRPGNSVAQLDRFAARSTSTAYMYKLANPAIGYDDYSNAVEYIRSTKVLSWKAHLHSKGVQYG